VAATYAQNANLNNSTNNANRATTLTPAVNGLLLAFVGHTGSTADGSVTDDQSGTWTKVVGVNKGTDVDRQLLYVRDQLVTSAVLHTITFNSSTNTGGFINVYEYAGMSRTGAAAIRQTAVQANQAASGTPAPAFASGTLSGNPQLGSVFNASNPATLTAPAQDGGWTEHRDTGYNTPTTGQWEGRSPNAGASGTTTVTWGSTSATEFCSLIAELDSSAAGASGTFVLTGGGVLTAAQSTQRNRSGSLVGGGVLALVKSTARNLAQLLTGGGVVTPAKTTNRNRSGSLTGGGIIVISGSASSSESHSGAAILTGGGVINWLELTGRLATTHLTGGGALIIVGGKDVALSDLGAVMCAMGDALEAAGVASGRVFCYPPDSVNAPATVVGYPTTIEFDSTMQRGADRLLIPVYYVTGRTSDAAAQQLIAGVITGAAGIKDVLDGNLGGAVDTLRVQDMRVVRVDLAGVEYLSAVFTAEVFV
jgi:hypothetical protein